MPRNSLTYKEKLAVERFQKELERAAKLKEEGFYFCKQCKDTGRIGFIFKRDCKCKTLNHSE